jgi:signal transduction histidine kinase
MFRILGWMSMGVLILAALALWYHNVVQTADNAFETALLFLSALAAGMLFGVLVGYYDVRVRELIARASREEARREYLDEQQETLSSLNGILRHQILNDLSAISGRAELLEAEKIDRDAAVDSIVDHCDHMESIVQRIETVVDVLTHVSDASDVSTVEAVEQAHATASDAHPELTVDTDGMTDLMVRADELLYLALAEIFENAAVHADGDVAVTDRETEEAIVIEVSDKGPGVDLSPANSLFQPNTRGPESDGDGLGLFLADLIVERYDGSIDLVDGEDGATFEVEIPKEHARSDEQPPDLE